MPRALQATGNARQVFLEDTGQINKRVEFGALVRNAALVPMRLKDAIDQGNVDLNKLYFEDKRWSTG